MNHDFIKKSLDMCLENMKVTNGLREQTYRNALRATTDKRYVRIPRPRLVLIFAILLILMVTTAAALTIIDIVRTKMQPLATMYIDGDLRDWDLDTKLAYIKLMKEWRFDLNKDKLEMLNSGNLSDEEKEELANEVMWECVGERIKEYRAKRGMPQDQSEEYPIPSDFVIFEMLWLFQDPEADEETIQMAFEEWQTELRSEADTAAKAKEPSHASYPNIMDETIILDAVDRYMSESLSMSKAERNAASVMLEHDTTSNLWQVAISVSGIALRDPTRNRLQVDYCEKQEYDKLTDTYYHYCLFDAHSALVEGYTLDGYDFNQLVPREAYPSMPERYAYYEYFDPYKCFLYSSAKEKAVFSQKYKPIVDSWLTQHPQYATWLASQQHYLYEITRNSYGTPPPNMLQQDLAVKIAYKYCMSQHPGLTVEVLANRYHNIVYYDVSNPGKPVWKIVLLPDWEKHETGDVSRNLYVVIDVWSGKVIRDQHTQTQNDIEF